MYIKLLPLLSAFFVILLGLIVFIKKKRTKINFLFFFSSFFIFIWLFGTFMMLISTTEKYVFFWDKFIYIGVIFIPSSLYYFVTSFLNIEKEKKKIIFFGYLLSFIFLFFNIFSKFFINEIYYYSWGTHSKAQIIHHFFLIFFIFYIILIFKNLFQFYKKFKGIKKEQIKYFFVAFIFLFLGSLAFLPAYGINVYPIVYIAGLIFVVILFYAIVKHRLMDIKFILRRSSVYISSVITITFLAIAVKYFIIKYFSQFYEWTDILILVASVSIFVPIKNYYYKLANKYFFTSLYNSNEVISSIGNKLQSTLDIYKIYNYIYEEFDKSFHINAFGFLKYDKKTDSYVVKYNKNFSINLNQKFKNNKLLDIKYSSKNEILALDEIKNSNDYNKKTKKLIDKLIKLKIDIIIPLNIKGKNIGIMILGSKKSKDIYNDEDLQILKIISSQVAIAIENASLYKKVENFNKYLKEKVDEQTKDIKAKSEHLQKLLTMRSEFLNIASHQLRTPVSVIKGVLSILGENNIPEQKKQELLKTAFEKSIKLNEIINSILKASEMESENFKIKFKTTNLGLVLKEIYNSQISVLKNKDLKIILNLPKKQLPNIKSDKVYLKHVFNNLINNSLQYTKKGSIIINVAVEKNKIIVKIIDTGIGIPKEEIPKLFHKFVRAKNAVESYTDGTGLGLFIVKKIINVHKGAKVYIEKTEIGKGTTMTVEFLINI